MRKQIVTITLGLLLCIMITLPARALSNPLPELDKSHLYIQDHAHVLSETEIRQMNALGKKLEKDTGIEMLMVTMDSVDQPRRDYALRLLREYGVGKKDINNGIVIFLNLDKGSSAEDRGIEIQIGYGLEGYFTDARVGTIIDENGLEDLKKGAYNTGLKNIYRAMYDKSQDAYRHIDKNTELSNGIGTRWYFLTHHNINYILGYLKEVLLFLLFGVIYPLYAWYLYDKYNKDKDSDNNHYGGGRPSDSDYYGSSGSYGGGGGSSSSSNGGYSSGGGGFGGGTGGGGGAGRGF